MEHSNKLSRANFNAYAKKLSALDLGFSRYDSLGKVITSYASKLAIGAAYKVDINFDNEGPSTLGINGHHITSKTAIAHKILFDSSSAPTKLFAKGFHRNIYDNPLVIESFRNYARRMDSSGNNDGQVLITLISREPDSLVLRKNLSGSLFVEAAHSLSYEFGYNILNVNVMPSDSIVKFKPVVVLKDDSHRGIELLTESEKEVERNPYSLNSFGLFDGAYRFRRNDESNHEAFVNFGSKQVFGALDDVFESLRGISKPYTG